MICNYADDNNLLNESNCFDALKVLLKKGAHRAISWFDNNYMDANPDKFQCISFDRFGDFIYRSRSRETLSHLLTVLQY